MSIEYRRLQSVLAGVGLWMIATPVALAEDVASDKPKGASGWAALPGVFYTTDQGLNLSGAVLRYFRLGGASERPSRVQTTLDVSFRGSAKLVVKPDLWFDRERIHVVGRAAVSRREYSYYGVGNDTRIDQREAYDSDTVRARAEVSRRVNGALYVGGLYDFHYQHIRECGDATNPCIELMPDDNIGGFLSGLGGLVRLDTRDNTFAPRRGALVTLSPRVYHRFWGSDYEYVRLVLDGAYFINVWRGHVLAVDGRLEFNFGDPPLDQLSLAGGTRLLRGLRRGRFRDKHLAAGQVEYRLPLWWRFGAVAFAGLGTVFGETDVDRDALKFSVGAGLRFALKPDERINVRFDVGVTNDDYAIYFKFLEAF